MSTGLKILFVIDSLVTGGAETYLAELLPQLRRAGVATIVVSLRPRAAGLQEGLEQQGFDVRNLRASGLIGRVVALRRMLRVEQPDVLQTVLFHADLAGRLAAIGTSIKVVSRLVNTDYDEVRLGDPTIGRTRFRLSQWIDGWTARHLTDQLMANSNAVKVAAMRDLKVSSQKVTVFVESRESARLGRPGEQRRQLARRQLGLDADQEVLVNVGRQDYQKGQRYLLEAMAKLAPTRPRLVLLVAGRAGSVSGELLQLQGSLGLQERVRFLGYREDVPEILAAADLFVFPSFYEGLPGAVIEAMALGLPIVASAIDPVREVVEEGRNALLVEPASAPALATAIESLLEDRHTAVRFGMRSRKIFENGFTLEQGMDRLLAFYREGT